MSIFCLFCIFVIYFSIFFFTVLSHFCKSFFSFFHFLFFITQYGFFPFIMVIWLQRGVICMKTFFKNLTFTFLCLGISTILAFFFFNLVLHPVSNKSLHYQRCVWCFSQYNRRHCQTFHNGRSASKKASADVKYPKYTCLLHILYHICHPPFLVVWHTTFTQGCG